MLATKLDNIFLRYTKIFINLSIFDIKEGFVEKKETNKRFPEFHDKGKEKVNFAFNERGNVTRGSKFGSKIEELSYTNVLKKYVYNHSKRFNKAFIWVVEHARNSYNIHESFNLEGYFSAKVTPLGENLFLLEDKEEGELAKLMELGASLLMQWFEEIRRWEPSDVDQERIVNQMDVAAILMRTRYAIVLNVVLKVSIDGKNFNIRTVEDGHGPLRVSLSTNEHSKLDTSNSYTCSDNWPSGEDV
ncbi:hypothetical protein KIW84_073200 [Lathyrus oleraceus]|uniref:Uncharacterized protein n=1 Tax=Pisum sativum TaxID=3888 RepID=A0A9D4ZV92_PEA|nr:hypothetical protein KIW84_073200 [Pisum sativum]